MTVYHEDAEASHQGTRVLQLEHNASVLLQELIEARNIAATAQTDLQALNVCDSFQLVVRFNLIVCQIGRQGQARRG